MAFLTLLGFLWVGANCALNASTFTALDSIAQSFSSVQSLKDYQTIDISEYNRISDSIIQKVQEVSRALEEPYYAANEASEGTLSQHFLDKIQQNPEVLQKAVESLAEDIKSFCDLQKEETPDPFLPIQSSSIISAFRNIDDAFGSFLFLYEKADQKVFTNFAFMNRTGSILRFLALWQTRLSHMIEIDQTRSSPDLKALPLILEIKAGVGQFVSKIQALEGEYKSLEQMYSITEIRKILASSLKKTLKTKTGEEVSLIPFDGKNIVCVYQKSGSWTIQSSDDFPAGTRIIASNNVITSPIELAGLPEPEPFILSVNMALTNPVCNEGVPEITPKKNIILDKRSLYTKVSRIFYDLNWLLNKLQHR